MKYKIFFTRNLIVSMIAIYILISMFIKTVDIFSKVILLPFILLCLINIIKNISLLFNKNKYIKLLNKIFYIIFFTYILGFLLFWSYLNIINSNYIALLFAFPFLALIIYIIYKKLLKKENKHIKLNINIKSIITVFLVGIILISGIILLCLGIKDTYVLSKKTKNYIYITGYFKDYKVYSTDKEGTTYKLVYTYTVNNRNYEIETDYGSGYIPKQNSTRKVKYNPKNPNQAILIGTNGNNFLIFMGSFFTFGSLLFVLTYLQGKGFLDKFKIDIIRLYIGLLFFMIGIGIILLQNGMTMSLLETIKSLKLWILIPIMFIVVGISQIIICINDRLKH